jgi:hypothetical protein
VDEALAMLAGTPAGERLETGEFAEGSVNRRIEDRLMGFARARRRFGRKDTTPSAQRDAKEP